MKKETKLNPKSIKIPNQKPRDESGKFVKKRKATINNKWVRMAVDAAASDSTDAMVFALSENLKGQLQEERIKHISRKIVDVEAFLCGMFILAAGKDKEIIKEFSNVFSEIRQMVEGLLKEREV